MRVLVLADTHLGAELDRLPPEVWDELDRSDVVLHAYIPFEAPDEVRRPLEDLATELDSEHLRTQLVVTLDAESRLSKGGADTPASTP